MARSSRRSDLEIQADVIDVLHRTSGVQPAHIGVSVKRGIVTLSGEVVSAAERLSTKSTVCLVTGVRAVVDEVMVREQGAPGTTDADLVELANRTLGSAAGVPEGSLQVKVRDGVITLSGDVSTEHQRATALEVVRSVRGAVGFTDDVRVDPPPAPRLLPF